MSRRDPTSLWLRVPTGLLNEAQGCADEEGDTLGKRPVHDLPQRGCGRVRAAGCRGPKRRNAFGVG